MAAPDGVVDTLLVNIDEVLPGTVDEIAGRVLLSGGTVIGGRRADLAEPAALAGILCYAF